MIFSLMSISIFLSAEIEYEIHDIGTLQTRESNAIDLNNQGQILGWYNIDGTNAGKHFFVRNRDGSFFDLPSKENSVEWDINWRYLTDNGEAYGTFDDNANFAVLYMWDQKNGVVKLGNLPGKEISAINNSGQVLINSIQENEGKSIRRPIIWQNGQITKLKGCGGDLGIESEESYGFDMNNKGEVIGQSLVNLSYKNKLYTQIHAVKWVGDKVVDMHNEVPKEPNSYGFAINDHGDVLITNYLIRKDGQSINLNGKLKKTDTNYLYTKNRVVDRNGIVITNIQKLSYKNSCDQKSIWWALGLIINVNDNGDIIANGRTIWGEEHALLLTPIET